MEVKQYCGVKERNWCVYPNFNLDTTIPSVNYIGAFQPIDRINPNETTLCVGFTYIKQNISGDYGFFCQITEDIIIENNLELPEMEFLNDVVVNGIHDCTEYYKGRSKNTVIEWYPSPERGPSYLHFLAFQSLKQLADLLSEYHPD